LIPRRLSSELNTVLRKIFWVRFDVCFPYTLRYYFCGSYKDGVNLRVFMEWSPIQRNVGGKCSGVLRKTVLWVLLMEIAGLGEGGSLWRPLPKA
jgi:hypothetical protein